MGVDAAVHVCFSRPLCTVTITITISLSLGHTLGLPCIRHAYANPLNMTCTAYPSKMTCE